MAASGNDSTIVRSAIQKYMTHPMVAIVGENVGLVALLMALALPEKAIFFIKPRRGNVETKHFRHVLQLSSFSFSPSSP